MITNKQINEFAEKWLKVFSNDINFHDIFETMIFSKDCEELGFEMDCGDLFCEKYNSEAFYDLNELKRIIENIFDINIIGTALHSKWRYHNRSDYVPYKKEDNDWFIICLRRLVELTI